MIYTCPTCGFQNEYKLTKPGSCGRCNVNFAYVKYGGVAAPPVYAPRVEPKQEVRAAAFNFDTFDLGVKVDFKMPGEGVSLGKCIENPAPPQPKFTPAGPELSPDDIKRDFTRYGERATRESVEIEEDVA